MNSHLNITHFAGPIRLELGGVVRAILDMAGALAAQGHGVTVVTHDPTDVPELWRHNRPGVPKLVQIDPPGALGKPTARSSDVINRIINASDIVHLHTPWDQLNPRIAKACTRLGTPYFISIHGMLDDWSMSQKSLKKQLFLKLSAKAMLEHAAAVHCTAQAELDQSKRWYPGGTGVVVPLIFDLDPYLLLPGPESAREHFNIDPSTPAVLFLSRLHVKKGVHILIDAAKILADRGVKIQLLLAGTGDEPYIAGLRSQIQRLGLEDSVRLLGMVKGEQKVSLYEAADVFALPTSQENFGFVLPEALACRTPAITTRGVDIWPELESSGSTLIIDQTADAFADALADLLSDDARREMMGESGRSWVLETLNPESVVGRYSSLYHQATGEDR